MSVDINAVGARVREALPEFQLRGLIRRGSGVAWDAEVKRLSEELSIPVEEVRSHLDMMVRSSQTPLGAALSSVR